MNSHSGIWKKPIKAWSLGPKGHQIPNPDRNTAYYLLKAIFSLFKIEKMEI
jgi:hypothetical protein